MQGILALKLAMYLDFFWLVGFLIVLEITLFCGGFVVWLFLSLDLFCCSYLLLLHSVALLEMS